MTDLDIRHSVRVRVWYKVEGWDQDEVSQRRMIEAFHEEPMYDTAC